MNDLGEAERVAAEVAWERGYLAGRRAALEPTARTPENPYERVRRALAATRPNPHRDNTSTEETR